MKKKVKFLKPVNEAKVRDPKTMLHLAQKGEQVEMTSFWARRIADGSVKKVVENIQENIQEKPTAQTFKKNQKYQGEEK